jgi:tetratricopeptide (TPR) repeat protein
MTRILSSIVSWFLTLLVGIAVQAQDPARFDMQVRNDFFAAFAGDQTAFARAMDACERTLADDPKHPEALVWHGSGLTFKAGLAFRKGDTQTGMELFARGTSEMDDAVALAPDNVGVRIPRGAVLLTATRTMPAAMARPLLEKALSDYERTLEIQEPYFKELGEHPKGELLFGLAEGYSRLGQLDKARAYFERLTQDAPGSGQTVRAKEWLATGTLPKISGTGCIGCHK